VLCEDHSGTYQIPFAFRSVEAAAEGTVVDLG